jgi:translation initiation factor IF-3
MFRINGQITGSKVRVIGSDGKQQGIMTTAEALKMARGLRMDLVEIAPSDTPPVVRIVDYEKFKRERRGQRPPDYTNN